MEAEAAALLGKYIGAGLAAIALAGAGVGIGHIFGNYLSGALRNPSAAQQQFPNLLLGFALAEATGLFGLVVALILLFVVFSVPTRAPVGRLPSARELDEQSNHPTMIVGGVAMSVAAALAANAIRHREVGTCFTSVLPRPVLPRPVLPRRPTSPRSRRR